MTLKFHSQFTSIFIGFWERFNGKLNTVMATNISRKQSNAFQKAHIPLSKLISFIHAK